MKLLTPFLMLFFSLCFTAVLAQGASPTVSFDVMGYPDKSPDLFIMTFVLTWIGTSTCTS